MYYSILPRLAQGPHGFFLPAPQVAAVPPTLWSEEGGPPTAERVYPFVKMGVPFAAERVYPFRRKGSTLPDAGGLPLQQQGVYPFAKKSGELGSKEWGVLVKRVGRLGQRCGEHRSTRRQGCNDIMERAPCNGERANNTRPSGVKFAMDNYRGVKRRENAGATAYDIIVGMVWMIWRLLNPYEWRKQGKTSRCPTSS